MGNYAKTKIYYDGSHYIGIPHITQAWKRKKIKPIKATDERKEKFEKLYKENESKSKRELKKIITDELVTETGEEFIKKNFERKKRNAIERRKRLYRKVFLHLYL